MNRIPLSHKFTEVDPFLQDRSRHSIHKMRGRAKEKNVPFDVKQHEVYKMYLESDMICPILGVKMVWSDGETYNPYHVTIDRKDPDKGYVIDNMWLISRRANQIKSDASLPELIRAMANLINELYQGEHNERTGIRHRDGSEAQYDLDLCN